jgi:hypothetical protein
MIGGVGGRNTQCERGAEVLETENDTITGSGRLDKEEHHVRNYTIH